jgi:hypothetical protein
VAHATGSRRQTRLVGSLVPCAAAPRAAASGGEFSRSVLGEQGAVLEDVLSADAALVGYSALARADRCWAQHVTRVSLPPILALGLFIPPGLTRQNGIVAPLFGGVATAVLVWRRVPSAGRLLARTARALAAGGMGPALALGLIAASTLAMRTPGHARESSVEAVLRTAAAPVCTSGGTGNIVNLPGGAALTNPLGPASGEDRLRLVVTRPRLCLGLPGRVWLGTLLKLR